MPPISSHFRDLRRPVIAAPMAGGPTTPELVSAAEAAGGIGFLAAGYQSVEALRTDIDAVRAAGTALFGVNLFITLVDDARRATTDDEIARFSETLQHVADAAELDGPGPASFTDNDFAGKIDFLCENPVPVVSFTFGIPERDVINRLHAVGSEIAVMVTSVADARTAVEHGVDGLIVQGTEAGGHQSTLSIADTPGTVSTVDLVRETAGVSGSAIVVATGGIHSDLDAKAAFDAGADVLQIGTALLNTPEAGTSRAHRYGLSRHFGDLSASSTEITRGFSGRPARSIRNEFVAATENAPSAYPYNNQMTKPIRASAAKKDSVQGAEYVALWCGESLTHKGSAPAGLLEGESVEAVFERICPVGTTRSE